MSESIDNKLKGFYNKIYNDLKDMDPNVAKNFLEKNDGLYLSDELKYEKWSTNIADNDIKDIEKFKSADFLESKEFQDWPIEKKIQALGGINFQSLPKTKYKPEELFTLSNYKALIEKNKTSWSPELKNYSINLIPFQQIVNLNIGNLGEIGFAS